MDKDKEYVNDYFQQSFLKILSIYETIHYRLIPYMRKRINLEYGLAVKEASQSVACNSDFNPGLPNIQELPKMTLVRDTKDRH